MSISARLRFEVLRRDGFRCRYCGASSSTVELHVDHVVPVSAGGSDSLMNLVAACQACNSGKSSIILSSEEREAVASDLPETCEHWSDLVGPPTRGNGWTGSYCGNPADGVASNGEAMCELHLRRFTRIYQGIARRHPNVEPDEVWWRKEMLGYSEDEAAELCREEDEDLAKWDPEAWREHG